MTIYSLSQKWKISKSQIFDGLLQELVEKGMEPEFWTISTSNVTRKQMIFYFHLQKRNSLQKIMELRCQDVVQDIVPIVSKHVGQSIILPRVRVYCPFDEKRLQRQNREDFLTAPQSIIFFSFEPHFGTIYKAILSWLLKIKES